MADIDIDPFGEHESRPEEPMDEHVLLTPVGGGSTWDPSGVLGSLDPWEPTREQETSFGGKSFETLKYEALESFVKSLYRRISGSDMNPWEQSIFIISTSEMDSYTTRTMPIP